MSQFIPNVDQVAQAFPHLQVVQRLGDGGQKIVFKAITTNQEVVALKIIKDTANAIARTNREHKASQKLVGHHFASIYDTGEVTINGINCLYIIEEFIEGTPLSTFLNTTPQPLDLIRLVGENLIEALVEVEAVNLVHRDIKPDNIMMGPNNRIVLIDFGMARHLDEESITADIALFGPLTPGYCAPEQINNEKRIINIRTDLFALGVVLYEMATGANPFLIGVNTRDEIFAKCLSYDPPPLSTLKYDMSFSDFVAMCMEKAAHKRPQSAKVAKQMFGGIVWKKN